MTDSEKKNIQDRFAMLKKKYFDWMGQSEPGWDKKDRDELPINWVLDQLEEMVTKKKTSFPTLLNDEFFKYAERRIELEINGTEN